MKSTDLMIGDYVLNPRLNNAEQVIKINKYDIILNSGEGYQFDDIDPIPLTPEILEKNGYERREDLVKVFGDTLPFIWEDDAYASVIIEWLDHYNDGTYNWNGYWKLTIDNYRNKIVIEDNELFVHELQHALKLCGIEKEIVL